MIRRRAHPVLVDERSAVRDGGAPCLEHTRRVVGMRVVVPGSRIAHPVRSVVSEHVLDLRADVGGRSRAGACSASQTYAIAGTRSTSVWYCRSAANARASASFRAVMSYITPCDRVGPPLASNAT